MCFNVFYLFLVVLNTLIFFGRLPSYCLFSRFFEVAKSLFASLAGDVEFVFVFSSFGFV